MLADVGHIVVVDDDPALRQMVTRYLEEHNIPTKSASNRTELTAILKRRIPVRSFCTTSMSGFDLRQAQGIRTALIVPTSASGRYRLNAR